VRGFSLRNVFDARAFALSFADVKRSGYSRVFFSTIVLFVCCSLPDYQFRPEPESSCTDKMLNGSETDTDCGGNCQACSNGDLCSKDSDCALGSCVLDCKTNCSQKHCQAVHCTDEMRSDGETDLNCGGPACAPCGIHQRCLENSDCASNACIRGICFSTSCADGATNGTETDLDCGGDICPACSVNSRCEQSGDCDTGNCFHHFCSPEVCGNQVKDEGEQGVDCGGICQYPCDAVTNCSNGSVTEAETDKDCGGGVCPGCPDGNRCKVNPDCLNNACTSGICTAPCVGSQCDGGGGAGGADGGAGESGQGGAAETGGTSQGGTMGRGGAPASGGTGSGGAPSSGGTLAAGGVVASGGTGQGGSGTGGTVASGGSGTGGSATGGATMLPEPTCSGCAKLSVPLNNASDKANFVIFLPNATNFGSAVMTLRIYRQAGWGGQLKGYVQHSGSPDYAQLFQGTPTELSSLSGWQDVVWNVGAHVTTFDKSNVARVGVQITAAGSTSWINPTVVYIDSITLTGASTGPWNFDNSSSISTSAASSGSANVMFLNSGDSPVSGANVSWFSR